MHFVPTVLSCFGLGGFSPSQPQFRFVSVGSLHHLCLKSQSFTTVAVWYFDDHQNSVLFDVPTNCFPMLFFHRVPVLRYLSSFGTRVRCVTDGSVKEILHF